MTKHWIIRFRSLRAGTVYTVSIYDEDYTGLQPVELRPAAQPFTTDEDDSDDMFTPIRTQTGYLSIVDDGYDLAGNPFNWKEFLPATDTSRPVVLSHMENGAEVTDWMGFLQAQNFSGTLYGGTQERQFPIHCALSATQGQDVDVAHQQIENFAYLIKAAIDSVPAEGRPTHIVVQGGAKAQEQLLKRLDWQLLTATDDDGQATSRYDMFQVLSDLCAFWGWTARTYRHHLVLACADDPDATTWLSMTAEQLATMAAGTPAGTTDGEWIQTALTGDIFASAQNDDTRLRGYSKVVVTADGGSDGSGLVDYATDRMVQDMEDAGWNQQYITDDDKIIYYTNPLQSFSYATQQLQAHQGAASFNMAQVAVERLFQREGSPFAVIRITNAYSAQQPAAVQMSTVYEHGFSRVALTFSSTTYKLAHKYESQDSTMQKLNQGMGNKTMVCALGIGRTRETSTWWNGRTWVNQFATFHLSLGNTDDILYTVYNDGAGHAFYNSSIVCPQGATGRLFFDIYGSEDMPETPTIAAGSRAFELAGFSISASRAARQTDQLSATERHRANSRTYRATNHNANNEEFGVDNIYASDNLMAYGFGLLINPDGTFVERLQYGALSLWPEQRLADRVARYWETSRRQLRTDLRTEAIPEVTPCHHLTIDGSHMYPVAISHLWRDDVTILTAIEVDPLNNPNDDPD